MPTTKPQAVAATRTPKKTPQADAGKSPSELIDQRIAGLNDWRAALLAQLRAVISICRC